MGRYSLALFAWAALVAGTASSSSAQCSALTNMQNIASGHSGVVLSTTLDDSSQFTVSVSSGPTYTFYVGEDCVYSSGDLAEDAGGYGYIDAEAWYSVVIEFSCGGGSGGVVIDITRDSVPEAHEYVIDATGTVTPQFPPDSCPCAGIGGVRIRGCTPYACSYMLVCKMTNPPYGTATAWCTPNNGPNP